MRNVADLMALWPGRCLSEGLSDPFEGIRSESRGGRGAAISGVLRSRGSGRSRLNDIALVCLGRGRGLRRNGRSGRLPAATRKGGGG